MGTHHPPLSRRDLLAAAGAAGLAGLAIPQRGASAHATPPRSPQEPFGYCLNTSTIRGQNLSLPEQVDIAAQAGYSAIEPWVRDIQRFVEQGGDTADLKKRIADHGLSVESAIGFAQWIVDDDQLRARELETARHDMELVRAIGGKRIAAPPTGVTRQTDLDLRKAAERYRALIELGRQAGVIPQLELWGFSKSLSRLGELMMVAVECGDADACLLPDVYHIYKGGSDFAGLRMIAGSAIHVFHVNDYPADPPRETISDGDRVYPGDGVAPLGQILKTLQATGFRGALSLELFNAEYWKQDALTVARTGLEKTRAAVQAALAPRP